MYSTELMSYDSFMKTAIKISYPIDHLHFFLKKIKLLQSLTLEYENVDWKYVVYDFNWILWIFILLYNRFKYAVAKHSTMLDLKISQCEIFNLFYYTFLIFSLLLSNS